jgi:hypothetical protein
MLREVGAAKWQLDRDICGTKSASKWCSGYVISFVNAGDLAKEARCHGYGGGGGGQGQRKPLVIFCFVFHICYKYYGQ